MTFPWCIIVKICYQNSEPLSNLLAIVKLWGAVGILGEDTAKPHLSRLGKTEKITHQCRVFRSKGGSLQVRGNRPSNEHQQGKRLHHHSGAMR